MTAPLNNLTDTWNNGATVFTGLKYNITNTASAAGSKLFDFQEGGNTVFNYDTAANVLSLQMSTTAQTLRVYNTYTDASNYERGIFDWTTTSNTLTIGTQALGTGTLRGLTLLGGNGLMNLSVNDNAGNVKLSNSGLQPAAGANQVNLGGGGYDFKNLYLSPGAVVAFGVSVGSGTYDVGVSRSAAGVIAFGDGSAGTGSATILAKTKAGAFAAGDIPSGTWVVGRDTSGATTKLIYNNAGTLMTVALT